jgi:uncharacterized protein YjbI with pentapeptide repeats
MANEEHVALLKQGTARWNAWRRDNPDVRPDFSGADLRGVNLTPADEMGVSGADLRGANFSGADLRGAWLLGGNFGGADLKNPETISPRPWISRLCPVQFDGQPDHLYCVVVPPEI